MPSLILLHKIVANCNVFNISIQIEKYTMIFYMYILISINEIILWISFCCCLKLTIIFLRTMNQIRSVAQLCPALCDPMNRNMPGLPVHQLPEFTQTHVHQVGDAIQWSHPLLFSPAFNLSHHQGLFQWVSSSHQVAKVLEFQCQHQSFLWIVRTDFF